MKRFVLTFCFVLFLAGCGMYISTSAIAQPVIGSATDFVFASSTQITGSDETTYEYSEKLPEALGTYLSTREGLLSLKEEGKVEILDFYREQLSPGLRDWTGLKNTNGPNVFLISYAAFGAMRDPERFRLYRLATKVETKPYIQSPAEIEFSVVPVVGVPGLLGNMVKLIPKEGLIRGNYLLTYPGIERGVELSWRFTIDGGHQSLLPFGVYLGTSKGLVKCQEMPLKHSEKNILLEAWASPPVQDMSAQDSIYTYSKGEVFRLYRLTSKKEFKPKISPLSEIELSIEPIGGSKLLGDVVQLAHKDPLVKGNYLLTEGSIQTANRCWGFTIEGGEPMWMKTPVAGCIGLSAGCLGITVVALVLSETARDIFVGFLVRLC